MRETCGDSGGRKAKNAALIRPIKGKIGKVTQLFRREIGWLTAFENRGRDVRGKPGERQDTADIVRPQLFPFGDLCDGRDLAFDQVVHPPPCVGNERVEVRVALWRARVYVCRKSSIDFKR